LGNTGLSVSVFGFGNWVTGHDVEQEEIQIDIIKRAKELGINYFDTAEIYGRGTAEGIFGIAISNST
jgi:aryl-alcohol dehydrogenase-like predicted oxidoreductase